jgi:hypothetical protein
VSIPSRLVEQLKKKNEQLEVIDLAIQGFQPADIARATGYTRQQVNNLIDEALANTSTLLLESVERLHLLNLMRIERLLSSAMPFALGEYTDEDGKTWLPDKGFMGMARDLIKLEMEWEDKLYDRRAKNPEQNADLIQQTMFASDDMYKEALGHLQAEWLGDYADMSALDLIPDKVTQEDVNRITPDKHLAKLEKKVDALLEEEGIRLEEDEEDAS